MAFEEDSEKNFLWREENASYIEKCAAILISRIHNGDLDKWHLRNETKERNRLDTIEAQRSHWKSGFDATIEYHGDKKDVSDRRMVYTIELKMRTVDYSFYSYQDVLLELVSIFQPLYSTGTYGKCCNDPCYSFKQRADVWGWFFTSKCDYIIYYFEANDLWILFSLDEMRQYITSKFLNIRDVDFENQTTMEKIYNTWRCRGDKVVLATRKEKNNGYLTLNGFASESIIGSLKSYRGIVKNRNDKTLYFETLNLPLQRKKSNESIEKKAPVLRNWNLDEA